MNTFFLTIVNMSISASWIVLAVLLLRLLLKKAPKWITVLLWGIVAIRLICPFSIESVMSLIPSAQTINPEILVEQAPVINPNIPVIDDVENPVINSTGNLVMGDPVMPTPDTTADNPVQTVITVLSYVWLGGIAGMLAYTVISYFRVKAKIGTAVRLRDNIFQSESVVSPFVLGLIKPKIYLPFRMNGQDMEHVIAHENAHICRKDHWWKPVGFLILTLHWFNPLLWLGYMLLCRDIELACDEKVIKVLDPQQKADYSQALLNSSVNRRIIAACPLAFGEVGIKERVKSVLSYKKPGFWIIVVAVVASIVTAVCFLTDPVDKTPDDTTQQTDLVDKNPDSIDVIDSLTEKFLNGEISATDKDGRKESIQDYLRGDYNKYALYDMSGDAVPELILKTGNGLTIFNVRDQGLSVWYEGTIYEKPLNNRAIFYERPGVAPEHTSYQYIVLDHNGEESQRTSFVESYGDNAEYFINGERVSKTAYEDLYKSLSLSDDAIVWKDIPPIDGTNSNKDQQFQSSTTEDLGAAESVLLSVLQNKNTFITSKGATVSLKDYKPVYKQPENADYYEETDVFVPREYTFVDLDKDGKRELIVAEAPYADTYLILREENKTIYGYSLPNRWFQSLKQDGSFQSSGGALINDYSTISFSQNIYQTSTIAKFYFAADNKKPVADKYGYAPDYEKSVFEINGKSVSFEEIRQFAEEWESRSGAVWIQIADTQAQTPTYSFIASCNKNSGGYVNFLNGNYYYLDTENRNSLYMCDADGKNAVCIDNCPGATLSGITVDETAVYYLKNTKLDTPLEFNNTSVSYSIPFEGQLRRYCDGKVTVLTEENVVDYALSKEYIFYTTADRKVYRMKHDGTEKTAIIDSTYPNICVSENKLYTHMGEGVSSTAFDGKNRLIVRAYHFELAASESAVYFISADDGSLNKMSLDGETIQKVISDPIRSFTVYNGRLVYERMDTNDIVIADMDGKNPQVVCQGSSPIVLNGHLFYLDNGIIKTADI